MLFFCSAMLTSVLYSLTKAEDRPVTDLTHPDPTVHQHTQRVRQSICSDVGCEDWATNLHHRIELDHPDTRWETSCQIPRGAHDVVEMSFTHDPDIAQGWMLELSNPPGGYVMGF